MNRLRRPLMWAALVIFALLTVFSIIGAFLGTERAGAMFNSLPLIIFWIISIDRKL